MQLFAAVMMPILYVRVFKEHGWKVLTDYPWGTAYDGMRLLVCLPLVWGVRRPWAYWLTIAVLALQLWNVGLNLLEQSSPFPYHDPFTLVALYILSGLLVYHFYRFAFGRPSRDYFRA